MAPLSIREIRIIETALLLCIIDVITIPIIIDNIMCLSSDIIIFLIFHL